MNGFRLALVTLVAAKEIAAVRFPPLGDDVDRDEVLEEDIFVLSGRRELDPLPDPPDDPEALIDAARRYFKDDVVLVSRTLNHFFPNDFLFYRPSGYEPDLFQAIDLLGQDIDVLRFDFDRIGSKGVDRYLDFNEVIQGVVRAFLPESDHTSDLNPIIMVWLFDILAELFTERSDYTRYWIAATHEEHYSKLEEIEQWSGRKEMKAGDLFFLYCTRPKAALTHVYRLTDDPVFDPWGGWKGFWIDMERVCEIPDLPFKQLSQDPVLREWHVIKKQFQGVTAEPVPHQIYNRILELIPASVREQAGLKPEPVGPSSESGTYNDEEDFEDQVIIPLLKRWGFRFQRQHPCRFPVGSQEHRGRVDIWVGDTRGPITLFENKLRILNDADRNKARDQARSYALMLGIPSFVVAAPEGLWLYSTGWTEPQLQLHIPGGQLGNTDATAREMLLKLRTASP